HPHDRRQWSRESADGIGDGCDGEGEGELLFGEFESLRNCRPCAGGLFAWYRRRWCHLALVSMIGNSFCHTPRADQEEGIAVWGCSRFTRSPRRRGRAKSRADRALWSLRRLG